MQVRIDGQTVEVFSGACVKDAVRKHSRADWKKVQVKAKSVFDRSGHEVAPDGELSEGEELFIRDIKKSGREL